jgi:hypothetical protein
MRVSLYGAIFFCCFGLFANRSGAQSQAQPMPMGETQIPAAPAGPLKILYGDKSSEWTLATLAALPHKMVTVHNAHTNTDETYSGVPLIDLLTPLGVNAKPRGKDLRLYVLAAGSDGYAVVYSIGEVTPDVSNATVLVADAENGKALGADGPFKLVATDEKRPARWVRNLAAIRVQPAE